MKQHYIITTALALSLVTGCVEINVGKGGHEGKDSDKEERGEKEDHEGKSDRKEKEEADEKEEKESKHEHAKSAEKEEKEQPESKAKLNAEAKISEAQARQIAMEKVPNGTIKEGELERENGHLQWSFDVATPGTKDITEVNIDAITGKVLAVDKESASTEAAEKKKEEKEKD